MNKEELILEIAKVTCTKVEAGKALDAAMKAIKNALKKGERVTLSGFGTFLVAKRSARNGWNPRARALIRITSKNVPKFTAGKAFKDYVN